MRNNLTTSAEGLANIVAREEEIGGLYDDASGYATYGVGHLVHPEKYRCFLLQASSSGNLCADQIIKSRISKTVYLRREVCGCAEWESLKSAAREGAKEPIAQAKFRKPYSTLAPADKSTVDTMAAEAVLREVTLLSQETRAVFAADVAPFERAVNDGVTGVELTQQEFDALVSFTFNVGPQAFKGSTLLKKINENKYRTGDAAQRENAIGEIAAQFVAWNQSAGKVLDGLTKRRKEEADRFLKQARAELDALKKQAAEAKKSGAKR